MVRLCASQALSRSLLSLNNFPRVVEVFQSFHPDVAIEAGKLAFTTCVEFFASAGHDSKAVSEIWTFLGGGEAGIRAACCKLQR